jgi:Holliday junction resolvase RusA-like endonuclease
MIFTLPLPETTNHAYATSRGRWYKTQKAANWEKEAGLIIMQSWRGKPIDREVVVIIKFYLKRDRDIDGGIKPVLDLLQRLRVYENDRQVKNLWVYKLEDKEWPRCEVSLELEQGNL